MTLDQFMKELLEEIEVIPKEKWKETTVVAFDMYGDIDPIKQVHLSDKNTVVNIWHEK